MIRRPRGRRETAAGAAGWLLRSIDRLCAVGYLAFSLWVLRDLWRSADSHGWAVLILAVPVVVGTALLAPSVLARTGAVLQLPRFDRWRGRFRPRPPIRRG